MRSLFCLLIGLTAFSGNAQSLEKFTYLNETYGANELYIGVNPTFTFIRNNKAPNPKNHVINAFTGDVSLRKVNFERGKISWNWQHKMIADVFLIVGKALKDDISAIDRTESTSLTCGIIGWFDFTLALNQPTGKSQFSLGVNHHDYFYGSTYAVDTIPGQGWISPDPQGYYFAAGPTAKWNYLLNPAIMFELSTSYSFSYWRAINLSYATNPSDDYPLPHFGQIDLEMQTKWGAFAGFNYNWIRNRGNIPAAGKRLDLIFGFRFMI